MTATSGSSSSAERQWLAAVVSGSNDFQISDLENGYKNDEDKPTALIPCYDSRMNADD